ncbi:MAG: ATP-binding protein [Candidatus Wildermuthbacteria bacterium]|nr:ATP-binding protein [Candidatus Wildermuthbacteria bacterium]
MVKREPLALIKNIILSEFAIGVFIIIFPYFFNLEGIYHQLFPSAAIRYNYFLVITSSVLQLIATIIVFLKWHSQYYERRLSILDMIVGGEGHHLELKQTFRWDVRQKTLNKELEKMAMKTIAGFLNSSGGKVILGVADDKSVYGLEEDYKTLVRQDRDGFENHFNHVFESMLGPKFRRFLAMNFEKIDNKDVCLIEIFPCDEPAYLKPSNNTEEFYIRAGNATIPLIMSKAQDYIKSRWK